MSDAPSAREQLAARAARHVWHHSIDLGHGVVTQGSKSQQLLAAEAHRIFDRVDIERRSVLDIGAWNGFFSFEAKHRGAGRVLATDSVCWTHPDVRGRESFDLATEALDIDVEAREIDVADMSPGTIGEFDIVLFLGVLYHRIDAIEALAKTARLARHLLIVETHLDLRQLGRPAMAFYPGRELANDASNWWGPNEQCLAALLQGHGFIDVEMTAHPHGRGRGIFHAWRSTELRRMPVPDSMKLQPAIVGWRAKTVRELCRPFRRWMR